MGSRLDSDGGALRGSARGRVRAGRPTTEGRDSGAVAQPGERLICNQEVVGSTPISSTRFRKLGGDGGL